MDRQCEVGRIRPHFNRQDPFRQELSGVRAGNPDPQDAATLWIG